MGFSVFNTLYLPRNFFLFLFFLTSDCKTVDENEGPTTTCTTNTGVVNVSTIFLCVFHLPNLKGQINNPSLVRENAGNEGVKLKGAFPLR